MYQRSMETTCRPEVLRYAPGDAAKKESDLEGSRSASFLPIGSKDIEQDGPLRELLKDTSATQSPHCITCIHSRKLMYRVKAQ